MPDGAFADRVVRNAENLQQLDVLGRHRDVGLEFVRPPTVGMLMFQQPPNGPI